jgi:hypothetical protein
MSKEVNYWLVTIDRPECLDKTRTLVEDKNIPEFISSVMSHFHWLHKDRITIETSDILPYTRNNE